AAAGRLLGRHARAVPQPRGVGSLCSCQLRGAVDFRESRLHYLEVEGRVLDWFESKPRQALAVRKDLAYRLGRTSLVAHQVHHVNVQASDAGPQVELGHWPVRGEHDPPEVTVV